MIDVSPELATALAGDQYCMADLYTITTRAGQVLRYTTADIDQTVNGHAFSSGMLLERGTLRSVAGLEVDTLEMTFYPTDTTLIGAAPFATAAARGALDGADILLERGYFQQDMTTPIGTIIRFAGRIADLAEFGRTAIPLTAKSYLEDLNVMMPRNIYQPGCRWSLYGAGCGISKASYGTGGAASAGSTQSRIVVGLGKAAGYFDLGTVTIASGANAGTTRTIKSHDTAALTVIPPLLFPIAPGDTLTAYAGCDKQRTTCSAKFNNVINFSGEPLIPAPETAY